MHNAFEWHGLYRNISLSKSSSKVQLKRLQLLLQVSSQGRLCCSAGLCTETGCVGTGLQGRRCAGTLRGSLLRPKSPSHCLESDHCGREEENALCPVQNI